MVGSRPSKEAAQRMGMVPYAGDGSTNGGSGYVNNNGSVSNYNNNNNSTGPTGYPEVNKGGYTKQGNAVPPHGMGDINGNQQLWSNGSGRQVPPQSWPTNENGVPLNPSNSWQNRQTNAGGERGYIQGPQNGDNSGPNHYVQQPQHVNSFGAPQRTISDGIPVNSNWQNPGQGQGPGQNWQNKQGPPPPNWQNQGGNGQTTQGPQQRFNVPKGDYVYYDGNGNQVNPNGQAVGNPNDKHFHHHYYSSHSTTQQPAQQQPYPYVVKKKERSAGAAALVAALATCWVCTCCCHPGC